LTGVVGDRPGPIDAVLRQLRAVRRRNNLRLVQHAAAVWVAFAASAAAGVVVATLRAGGAAFLLVALLALGAVLARSLALARRVARDWLPAGATAAHIDTTRGLRGRVTSVTELHGTAGGDLFALLVRQNLDALPRWRAEDVIPEVVPARAFASAVAAVSLLALVIVLAPALRPPPPRIVVGDRRMDFVPSRDTPDGAQRLLVAPGTEHPTSERDGSAAAPQPTDEPGMAGALADVSAALQDWLERALGVDERWEPGERLPESRRQDIRRAARERQPGARPMTGTGDATGDAEARGADGNASRRAGSDRSPTEAPGGGGGGAGAGSDTDPALYGAPHDEPGAGGDRFEVAIAARVRTRRGAAMEPWTTAPDPDADRKPVLAGRQRAEQPGHRMPVPASFAPLVRRLYAHPAGGGVP
jgi:hypothetical protein